MKNYVTLFTTGLLILCLSASSAMAGGFQLNLFGQRQTAMANVGSGMPLDLGTIALNPGGLGSLDHTGVLGGSSFTFITSNFQTAPGYFPPNMSPVAGEYEAETDNPIRTPFHIYAAFDTPVENLRAGIGAYTPYGNSLVWGDDWLYREMVSEISMMVIYIQPTVSYQINDRLGIGAGLIIGTGSVNLMRQVDMTAFGLPPEATMEVEIDGSTTAFGFNAGIHYQVNDMISAGVAYRSEVNMELEGGDAYFRHPEGTPPQVAALFPAENKFDSSLPMPGVLSLGLGIKPADNIRFGVDANLTFWSSYERLAFDFETNTALPDGTPVLADTDEPRNYKDRWIFRLGGEFDVSDALQLRLGTYYDPSVVDDGYMTPETPDVDRIGISGGVGLAVTPQLGLNASVVVVTSSAREQTLEHLQLPDRPDVIPLGEFKTTAVIPGISLSYRF